jgi:hypothetical protein
MSKDLLREAIADAKAVRETAIANARLALEEAFTPKLQSMLSTKIAEDLDDELEEDEIEMDAAPVMDEDEVEVAPAAEEEEVEAEEAYAENAEEEEVYAEDEEEVMEDEEEDLELESIIRELEAEEEEVTEEEEEEVPVTEEAEEELEEDEEEMDLEEIIRSLSENEDEEEVMEEEEDEKELEEAYKTIRSLKNTINEVNLLNSKLLFSNKLFRMHSLSESQKMNVIETFDRASSVREVKLVYTTLAESLVPATSSRKRTVTEGFASKSTKSTKPSKNVIVESNNFAARMQRLAGLK